MQRNQAIDAVKGFAILLVMLGHCIVLNGLNKTDPYIYDIIKSVQMPLFMMVSGVLAGMGVISNKDRKRMLLKLPRRAVSYLVPFFAWFVLVYLWTHLINKNLSFHTFFFELKQLLFQTDRGLWFLMTLFIVTVVVTVSQSLTDFILHKRDSTIVRLILLLIFCGFFYMLFILQSRLQNTFLSPSLTVQYFPFYVIGYVGNGYGVRYLEKIKNNKSYHTITLIGYCSWAICLILFLFMIIQLDLDVPADSLNKLVMQMTASLLGTVVCYFGVYKGSELLQKKQIQNVNEDENGKNKNGFLAFVGTYTLEIYVLHFRFARILHLADKNLSFYSLSGFAWLVASFILMSILTALSIWIIKKIKPLAFLLFGK